MTGPEKSVAQLYEERTLNQDALGGWLIELSLPRDSLLAEDCLSSNSSREGRLMWALGRRSVSFFDTRTTFTGRFVQWLYSTCRIMSRFSIKSCSFSVREFRDRKNN